jgi:hypothetical protein
VVILSGARGPGQQFGTIIFGTIVFGTILRLSFERSSSAQKGCAVNFVLTLEDFRLVLRLAMIHARR